MSNLHKGYKTSKENYSTFLVTKKISLCYQFLIFFTIILENLNIYYSHWQSYNKTGVDDIFNW